MTQYFQEEKKEAATYHKFPRVPSLPYDYTYPYCTGSIWLRYYIDYGYEYVLHGLDGDGLFFLFTKIFLHYNITEYRRQ